MALAKLEPLSRQCLLGKICNRVVAQTDVKSGELGQTSLQRGSDSFGLWAGGQRTL